jgi:hypothetical protein
VCRVRRSRSGQVSSHALLARGNVVVVQRAVEVGQCRLGLVVRHLMTRLVDTGKAEVAVLAYLAVFGAVNHHRLVARSAEFLAVGVVDCETDGLAAEPVADVVGITISQADAHVLVQEVLQIKPEVRVDEVSAVLEGVVDGVGAGVVECDAEGFLNLGQVEVIGVVRRRSGVIVTVADIIDTASAVVVVRRLDVVAAHIGGFVADLKNARGQLGLCDRRVGREVACVASGCSATDLDLVETSIVHGVCKLRIRIDGVVVCFDSVGADGVSRYLVRKCRACQTYLLTANSGYHSA